MEFGGGGGMFHGDSMSPEDYDKLVEFAGSFRAAQLSPLVRVVAIGQQLEADGIRVELIALEVREAVAVLYWKSFTIDGRLLGLAVIEVSDDQGVEYRVLPGGSSGGEGVWSGEVSIVPTPASDASMLRVKVTGFDEFPPGFPGAGPKGTNEGPWVFEVPLAHSA